jgi:hypothetical protein
MRNEFSRYRDNAGRTARAGSSRNAGLGFFRADTGKVPRKRGTRERGNFGFVANDAISTSPTAPRVNLSKRLDGHFRNASTGSRLAARSAG